MCAGWIALLRVDGHARAFFLVFHTPAGEFAVVGVAFYAEVDRTVDHIGMAGRDQLFDLHNLLRDMPAGARNDVGPPHVEHVHVGEVAARVAFGQFHRMYAVEARLPHELVFAFIRVIGQMADIGDVLHIAHFVADVAQIAHCDIEADVTLGMADVRQAIDGRTADVDSHMVAMQGDEIFFLPCERVIDLQSHRHSVPINSCVVGRTTCARHWFAAPWSPPHPGCCSCSGSRSQPPP